MCRAIKCFIGVNDMTSENQTERQSSPEPTSPCPVCAIAKYSGPCPGHAGGGASDNDNQTSTDEDPNKKQEAQTSSTTKIIQVLDLPRPNPFIPIMLDDLTVLSDKISIDIDTVNNELHILIKHLSPKEKETLKDALEKEIDKFKQEYQRDKKLVSRISIVMTQDKMIIQVPSTECLNAFIEHLKGSALSTQLTFSDYQSNQEQSDSDINHQGENTDLNMTTDKASSSPTPFSMQPAPKGGSTE